MNHILRGLFITLCVVTYATAQKAPVKFGDVKADDFKLIRYEKDTAAFAVVLVDFGQSELNYNQERGFLLNFERVCRIKILKTEGLELANIKIRTYEANGLEEKISGLKAVTYNLENGKVIETKMKNDGIFREKYDKNWNVTTFTFPNVKVGSILEYTYKLDSDFVFNFQDWEFQTIVPTIWSEYRARIPEYFNYEKYMQGYISFPISEHTTGSNAITFRYKERDDSYGGGPTKFYEEKLDYIENRYRWAAQDIPAFKEEPFLTTPRDYISKINFELAFTKYPNQPIKTYMGSWEDISKTYRESSDFGKEVTGNAFLKKYVEEAIAGLTSPEEKINAITRYLKGKVSWNGTSRSFSSSLLKKVFEEGKGNSAEINLLLASMLEKAGFTAYPVLLSTRDHGFIRESYPASTQFNYVICFVKYGDKGILLDATEPLLPTGVLPERCLNGRGLVVKEGSFWVTLSSASKSRTVAKVNLKLQEEGELLGDVTLERSGYDGLKERRKYLSKGEGEYLKDFTSTREWLLSKSAFDNVKEIGQAFKEKHDIEVKNHVTVSGDVMYVNPFIILQNANNPFKLEKREYPVDFGYAKEEMYFMTLTIPEGYAVDEMPKSKIFMLPGNASKYVYNVNQNGNVITITSNFSINKSLFNQIEYPDVREFFNQVVAKQSEQIVIKKKL